MRMHRIRSSMDEAARIAEANRIAKERKRLDDEDKQFREEGRVAALDRFVKQPHEEFVSALNFPRVGVWPHDDVTLKSHWGNIWVRRAIWLAILSILGGWLHDVWWGREIAPLDLWGGPFIDALWTVCCGCFALFGFVTFSLFIRHQELNPELYSDEEE